MAKIGCPPSNKCDGYPDPLLLPDVNEVSFYVSSSPLPDDDNIVNEENCDFGCRALKETMCYLFCEEILHGGTADDGEPQHQLACSLIMSNDIKSGVQLSVTSPSEFFPPKDWSEVLDQKKPVIIICHGLMSWRNQWLINNLAAKLSKSLDCHTLRFDFNGNGHSLGAEWSYSNYDVELNDLKSIVWYVENVMQCSVICIIGHSKGAASALRFAWEQDSGCQEQPPQSIATLSDKDPCFVNLSDKVPCFVNLAGRYLVPDESSSPSCLALFSKDQRQHLDQVGMVLWTTRGSRKFIVTKEAIEERSKQDLRHVSYITSSSVLTIHGDKDKMVCVDSAFKFDLAISNHELCIIQGANHNFSGSINMEELDTVISDFIRRKRISQQ